jgi:hypothetical protein
MNRFAIDVVDTTDMEAYTYADHTCTFSAAHAPRIQMYIGHQQAPRSTTALTQSNLPFGFLTKFFRNNEQHVIKFGIRLR